MILFKQVDGARKRSLARQMQRLLTEIVAMPIESARLTCNYEDLCRAWNVTESYHLRVDDLLRDVV